MIAQIFILLPYTFSIPADVQLVAFDITLEGRTGRIFPPYVSGVDRSVFDPASPTPLTEVGGRLGPVDPQTPTELVLIDGHPTIQADAVSIRFRADEFDRRTDAEEPLVELAFRMANDLLARLRTLGRAGHVKPIAPHSTAWRLVYANDDGSELEPKEGLRRGLGGVSWTWQLFGLRADLWEAAGALSDDFEPTAWDTLLLDAVDLLPEIGPAIVLAFAAIETRIDRALDVLASQAGLGDEVWEWITQREGDYRKEPSMTEQVDSLLKAVSGHTLKEDGRLWEAFQNVRQARNTFVHEGRARIGQQPLTSERASQLVALSGDVIEWIERLLPDGHQRPRYEAEGERFVQLTKWMTRTSDDAPPPATAPPSEDR
jgi:hypothetical protein